MCKCVLREGDVYLCVLCGYPNLFRREHIFLFLKSSLRVFLRMFTPFNNVFFSFYAREVSY